jgi:TonB family protein
MRLTFKAPYLFVVMVCVLFWSGPARTSDQETSDFTPKEDEFVPVEIMPELIHQVRPEYPEEARKEGIEGATWVKALVDTEGNVSKVELGKTSGVDALDQAALEAAKEFKFKPGLQKGKPVAVWVNFKVDFVLDDQPEKETATDTTSFPSPDEFVRVERFPEMIHQEPPQYPQDAKQAGIEGDVWVKTLVDTKGEPAKVLISKSSGQESLDKAARAAAMKSRFKPAVQDAKPVAVWVTYKISFVLSD